MQNAYVLCLVIAAFSCVQTVQSAKENPLGAVINLLDELTAKVTADGEAEAKAYHEYVEWCDDASKNFGFDIKDASDKKAKLEALIAKSADDSEAASGKIE